MWEPGTRARVLCDGAPALIAQGAEPAPTTPEELGRFMREDTARWARLVKERNLQLD